MNKELISIDVARKEVEKWLDYKRVNSRKREEYRDNIEQMANNISEGTLVLNEKCELEHTLLFAVGDNDAITKLVYKPRLQNSDTAPYLKNVKSSDLQGTVRAYICALTSKPSPIIAKLDTEDYSVAQSIAVFFV